MTQMCGHLYHLVAKLQTNFLPTISRLLIIYEAFLSGLNSSLKSHSGTVLCTKLPLTTDVYIQSMTTK